VRTIHRRASKLLFSHIHWNVANFLDVGTVLAKNGSRVSATNQTGIVRGGSIERPGKSRQLFDSVRSLIFLLLTTVRPNYLLPWNYCVSELQACKAYVERAYAACVSNIQRARTRCFGVMDALGNVYSHARDVLDRLNPDRWAPKTPAGAGPATSGGGGGGGGSSSSSSSLQQTSQRRQNARVTSFDQTKLVLALHLCILHELLCLGTFTQILPKDGLKSQRPGFES
jgi:hypothetical protein